MAGDYTNSTDPFADLRGYTEEEHWERWTVTPNNRRRLREPEAPRNGRRARMRTGPDVPAMGIIDLTQDSIPTVDVIDLTTPTMQEIWAEHVDNWPLEQQFPDMPAAAPAA